jgi:hypothetical protein
MDLVPDATQQSTGEPIGTGWRVAAWMAFAVALLIAWLVMSTKPRDFVHAAVLAAGSLLTLVVGACGLVFALFGAAASSAVGDKRVVIIVPVLANAGLLLWLVVMIFRP